MGYTMLTQPFATNIPVDGDVRAGHFPPDVLRSRTSLLDVPADVNIRSCKAMFAFEICYPLCFTCTPMAQKHGQRLRESLFE